MGLSELIISHDTEDSDELARLILEDVLQDEELMETIVLPALRRAVVNILRIHALEAERHSILSNKPNADPAADRLAFLSERFYVPTIGFVTWAEATIEHHEMRIDYLQRKVEGLTETQDRHETAIKEIKKAGAKNLGEVHKPRRKRAS